MTPDQTYVMLFARVTALTGITVEERYKRTSLVLDAINAHGSGQLMFVLEALRQRGETADVFRRMDKTLGVRSRRWCCGGAAGVYDAFSEDELMAALHTAIVIE